MKEFKPPYYKLIKIDGYRYVVDYNIKVGDRVHGTILKGNNVYVSDKEDGYNRKDDIHHISLEEAQIMGAYKIIASNNPDLPDLPEVFAPVIGYEGNYEVGTKGSVRSLKRHITNSNNITRTVPEKILVTSPHPDSYPCVTLCKNGIKNKIPVHILMGKAFLPNPDNLPLINHIDGDPTNNNLANLEYVSFRENFTHGRKNQNSTSKYAGVRRGSDGKHWIASISTKEGQKYLGCFDNENDAANAYKQYLIDNDLTNKYAI